MHTDPLSDFLTRLRNAQLARHDAVESPSSRMKFTVAKILQREGYVGEITQQTDGTKQTMRVKLKYDGKEPVIHDIRRISKPGLRVYRKASDLPRVLSDLGIAIISTSSGIMTNKEARRRKLGGEILCEVS